MRDNFQAGPRPKTSTLSKQAPKVAARMRQSGRVMNTISMNGSLGMKEFTRS